jgi:hypothetical protein
VYVVAAGQNLGLVQKEGWVTPQPEVGSAEGVDSRGKEPVQNTQAATTVLEPELGLVQVIDLVSELGPHRTES